ncbi:hypothetical protein C8R45DRAFT_1171271 [Mycena sanguinolenta]|nr:hypothetical protein C8R45DRAFT_1171271 [Mycena sanguinolenta]
MLSIATIFLSALLASASPARATCSPNISGTNISITNGPLEAGFSSTGSTLVSQPISVTIPEFAVATSNSTGQFTLLKVTDRELALTNAANVPSMAPIPSPDSRMQNWAVQCSSCVKSGGLVGAGCLVVSQFDGRCLNVSLSTTTPVGSPVTLGNCQAIGSSINIYTAAIIMRTQIQLLIPNTLNTTFYLKLRLKTQTRERLLRNKDTSAPSWRVNDPQGAEEFIINSQLITSAPVVGHPGVSRKSRRETSIALNSRRTYILNQLVLGT